MTTSNSRPSGAVVLIVLGIFGTAMIGTLLFYGAIAAVAIHFIHKFW